MSEEKFSRSEIREISRTIAREEFRMMQAEIKETVREVMNEKLGDSYEEEREFLHSWMKRTDKISSSFYSKIGTGVFIVLLAGIGSLVLAKIGFFGISAK